MTSPNILNNTYDFLRGRGFWLTIAGLTTFGLSAPLSLHLQDAKPSSAPAKEAKENKQDKDIIKWIERLGSSNFDERDNSMDQLRELGEGALKALDDAGENHTDAEVRWNARRLAREIRSGETPKVKNLKDLDNKDMSSSGMLRPRIQHGQSGGIHIEMPEIKELFERSGAFQLDPNSQFQSFSNGTSIQVGPDGVKVTITETDKDGNNQSKTYEAPSMEEFKVKYPEIAEKHLNGMHIFQQGIQRGNVFKLGVVPLPPNRQPWIQQIPQTGLLASADTFNEADYETIIGVDNGERLGVEVRPVPPDVAKFLKLKTNHGFMVHSVSEDSQAAALGIEESDIVISVNAKKIGEGGSPLREVLANIPSGELLKVVVVRGMEGQKTLEGKKLATANDNNKSGKTGGDRKTTKDKK
ncbi:MAG: hypothetical protein ACKVS6_04200 [Planctomycetota bacterium]